MSRIGIEAEALGDARLHQFDDARHGGLRDRPLDEIEVALALGLARSGIAPWLMRWALMMMRLCGGLPEHLGQAHHRHSAGRDDVGQHLAGADRGQLVDVADEQQRGVVRHRLQSACISITSTIEVSSTTSRSQSSGLSLAALEAAALGIDLQQPVDGLGLEPGRFGHALGGAAGRRAQQKAARPWPRGCAGSR